MSPDTDAARRSPAAAIGIRLLGAACVVIAAVTIVFWLVKSIPGDPVEIMLGPLATVGQAEKDAIRATLNLNQPVFVQYLNYLGQMMTGNLGTSYQLNEPVVDVLARAFAPTAALTSLSLLFTVILVALGILIARTRRIRGVVLASQTVAATLPIFWVSYILLVVFGFSLGWFPVTDSTGFAALILPAVALGIAVSAILGRIVHTALEDAQQQPFWLSIRARGSSQLRFDLAHGLRHGLGAALPLAVQIVGGLLGGAVIVEQIFGRPGLGSVALVAITNRDLPVILGLVALSAVMFTLLALLADFALWAIDPRLRPWRARGDDRVK